MRQLLCHCPVKMIALESCLPQVTAMSPRSTTLGRTATIGVLRPTRVAHRMLITLTSLAVATTWTGTTVTTGIVSGPFQNLHKYL